SAIGSIRAKLSCDRNGRAAFTGESRMDAPVTKSVEIVADAPLVKVDGVSRTYHKGGGNDLLVLQDVSLELRANEIVSLLGRSGSGKSTLLRIIAGLMPPSR